MTPPHHIASVEALKNRLDSLQPIFESDKLSTLCEVICAKLDLFLFKDSDLFLTQLIALYPQLEPDLSRLQDCLQDFVEAPLPEAPNLMDWKFHIIFEMLNRLGVIKQKYATIDIEVAKYLGYEEYEWKPGKTVTHFPLLLMHLDLLELSIDILKQIGPNGLDNEHEALLLYNKERSKLSQKERCRFDVATHCMHLMLDQFEWAPQVKLERLLLHLQLIQYYLKIFSLLKKIFVGVVFVVSFLLSILPYFLVKAIV